MKQLLKPGSKKKLPLGEQKESTTEWYSLNVYNAMKSVDMPIAKVGKVRYCFFPSGLTFFNKAKAEAYQKATGLRFCATIQLTIHYHVSED